VLISLSLPQWTAFWAAGWHPIVTFYKNRIYKLLHAMNNLVRLVLPANRNYAENYYGGKCIDKIELLLRSTRSAPAVISDDPDLHRLSQEFMQAEEKKLEARLATLLYQVDDSMAVALLTRRHRIERVGLSYSSSLSPKCIFSMSIRYCASSCGATSKFSVLRACILLMRLSF
jgi:hypothetical protein